MCSLRVTLDAIGHPKILVLGDPVLDRYTWGDAERISPEAPVIVLRADLDEVRLGGAASVASLLRGLDADVALAGVTGNDADGRVLRELLREQGIGSSGVLSDDTRPTTCKERFLGRAAARHPHQMLRVDRESRLPLSGELEDQLLQNILDQLSRVAAVLISDYGKGVCTRRLVVEVIAAARRAGIPTLVDPARGGDYEFYRGATLIKPNRIEAEQACGVRILSPSDAMQCAQHLCGRFDFQSAVITLDRDGMVFATEGMAHHVPIAAREVYDITGAGDMALAALGLCQAAHLALAESVQIANAAAGLEVAALGVAPITRAQLQAALLAATPQTNPKRQQGVPIPTRSASEARRSASKESSTPDPQKLLPLAEMESLAATYRRDGKRIVFTNGCFDLLHIGHATYLREAATLGDILIVAVNSDASVRNLKGPARPVIPQSDRAALLAALACVDHVLIFDDATPHALLEKIRPDVLVKGGTYTRDEVIGREVVESYGGTVAVVGQVPGISTTSILSQRLGTPC